MAEQGNDEERDGQGTAGSDSAVSDMGGMSTGGSGGGAGEGGGQPKPTGGGTAIGRATGVTSTC